MLITLLLTLVTAEPDPFAQDHAKQAALAKMRAQLEESEQAVADEEAALRKKCGKDYMRVRVGMKWQRVKECAGEFEIFAEDKTGTVYEAQGGWVRVEKGHVTRWLARP